MRYPVVIQHDEMDCGAACLAMIGRYYGIKMPLIQYRNLLCFDSNGTTVYDIVHAAKELNMNASCLKGEFDKLIDGIRLSSIKLPCIALVQSDSFFHFVVIYKITKNKIKYADPADGMHVVSFLDFKKVYRGVIITIEQTSEFRKMKLATKTVSKLAAQITDNKNLYIKLILYSAFIIGLGLIGSVLIELMVSSTFNYTNLDGGKMLSEEHVNENRIIELIVHNPHVIIMLLVIIYGLRLIIECFKSFTVTRVACELEENMSTRYFAKMINIPLNFFKGKKAGEYISRFNDVRRLNSLLADVITVGILNVTFIIGFGTALLIINPQMFSVTVLIVMVFSMFTLLLQKAIRKMNYTVSQNNSQMVSIVEETTKGIELIKTSGIEEYTITKFKSGIKKYVNILSKFANLSFLHNNIANWISSFGVLIILYVGITLCINREMEIDSLLVYYIVLSNFMPALEQLVCIQPKVSEIHTAIDRVEDVLGFDTERNLDSDERIDKIESIELVNVGYSYGLRKQVLTDVSFKVEMGEKIRITGNNGSGKSTLAHIIVGNYKDSTGEVLYNGKRLANYSWLKENITYVNQEVFLFHDSIYNNIVMGRDNIMPEEFIRVCEITGVNTFVNNFPEKYDYVLCDNGMNISGGQRRKIVLARALLRNTDVYIFDESTSNFDENSEMLFLEIAKKYLHDKMIIFISHNDVFNDYVDKIYNLEGGSLTLC